MSTGRVRDDARWTDVRRISAVGEPLIELQPAGETELRVSFGGDVANAMVCLARILGRDRVNFSLVTALGSSGYSAWLRNRLTREGIRVVEPASGGEPGIYGIPPDSRSQSTSSYWRTLSAARQFFHSAELQDFERFLGKPQILIVTGITLALCSTASFKNFCRWIEINSDQCRLVFDSNFRPALWASTEEAQERIATFERLATVIATGLEDEHLLWRANSVTDIIDRISGLSCEYVVRGGKQGCWVGVGKHWNHVAAAAVTVVDSVGAGDAHLAGYLAARITGCAQIDAARVANRAAAVIVSQRGSVPSEDAVLPKLAVRNIDE